MNNVTSINNSKNIKFRGDFQRQDIKFDLKKLKDVVLGCEVLVEKYE